MCPTRAARVSTSTRWRCQCLGALAQPDGGLRPRLTCVARRRRRSCVIIQTATIAIESHSLTLINHVVNAGCLLLYVALVSVMSVFPRSNGDAGVMGSLWANGASWGIVAWSAVVVLLPSVFLRWRASAARRSASCSTVVDGREDSCISLPLLRARSEGAEDDTRLLA